MAGHFIFVGTAILAGSMLAAASPGAPATHFASCTAMHKVYPHGVGKPFAIDHLAGAKGKRVTDFHVSTALYKANKSLDHDHDGIACEA